MPKWKDLRRYCESTGWELIRNTDHYYYSKYSPTKGTLVIKISKGSGEIGPHLWKHILKHELGITQEEFNKNI